MSEQENFMRHKQMVGFTCHNHTGWDCVRTELYMSESHRVGLCENSRTACVIIRQSQWHNHPLPYLTLLWPVSIYLQLGWWGGTDGSCSVPSWLGQAHFSPPCNNRQVNAGA